jgi:hypothetical protein
VTPEQVRHWLAEVETPPGFEVILPPSRPLDPLADPALAADELGRLGEAGATIVKASLVHHSLAHCIEQLEALASL